MKKKILLFISLVLLAVQGWSTPVDSLNTHLTLDSLKKWDKLEQLDTPIPFDGFIHPGFNPYELKETEDGHAHRFNPLSIIMALVPIIHIDEVDESETFNDVTVGTAVTKRFIVKGVNIYLLNSLLENMTLPGIIGGLKMRVKLSLADIFLKPPHNSDGLFESCEFSVDQEYIRAFDLREGQEVPITVTYNPTTEGVHGFRFIAMFDFYIDDNYGHLPDWLNLIPIINIHQFPEHSGSAVERTITTNESSLSFLDVPVDSLSTNHFIVTGKKLSGPLTLSTFGNDIDVFDIYPKSVSAEDAEEGREITVNYRPNSQGCHSAKIIINGGGAYPEQEVELIGSTGIPYFSVDPESLTFTNVKVGTSDHKSFTVRGRNLTSSLYLTRETTGANGNFLIDKDEISPAEAAEGTLVTVTYTPTEAGHLSGRISISGGSAGNKTISLDGYAEEPPQITVDQYSLSFPDAKVGVPVTKTIKVTGNNLTDDLSLIVDESDGSQFTIDPDKITAADAANGMNVTVTYTPTEEGTHSGRILISGGGAESKSVSLSGSAQEPPRITINPTSLSFPNKTVDKTYKQTFKVSGKNLTGDLTLTKDESDGGQFTFDKKTITAAEAKNGVNVTVTYAPTEEGSHSGRISITGGGADSKSVSLSGSAKERIITTSATSLNFGKVAKGKSKTKKFTVKGTNLTGPLTLEATGTNKSLFTISPSTITAAQAANGVEVSVTYKPTAKGSHTAIITISGGDALSDKTVDLSGQCVEPKITVSKETLDFGNIDAGTSKTLSFTVTGTDLTGDISLTVASTDSHADFTITPTTLGANASGATVKVTCTANVAGSISGRVTVSGGDATSKTVSLTGTVKCYITTNHNSLSYSPSSLNKSVNITCVGANSKLSLAIIGDDASYFTLGSSSISMADARDGKTVSIACVPKTKTSLSAKIKITGGGADDAKYVTLSYTKGSSGGTTQICSVEPDGDNEGGNNEFINGGSLEVIGASTTDVNELTLSAKVYAEGQTIIIESPVLQTAVISDIAGHAWAVDLQNGRNEIPVNASGIYIVRIREKTTKLMLK